MEILIVIVLLGVLATIIMGSYLGSLKKARDSRRKQDLEQISKALELYYSKQGQYPTDISFGDAFIEGGVTFMKALPQDPSGDSYTYVYESSSPYQEFELYSCLENDQDPDYVDSGYSETNCGLSCGPCKYQITSSGL